MHAYTPTVTMIKPPEDDFSLSYWYCAGDISWPDALNYIAYLVEFPALTLNLILVVLLFRLDGKTKTCLLMFRALSIVSSVNVLLNLIINLYPYTHTFENTMVNKIICALWGSNFTYWAFVNIGTQLLVFVYANRTMQIINRLQFAFAANQHTDLGYIIGMIALSICFTFPQIFTVDLSEAHCRCYDKLVYIAFLPFIYAKAYVIFFFVFLCNATILLICCIKVIRWKLDTPKDEQIDTLNRVYFADDSVEQIASYDEYRGWTAATMSMIPMTVTFIVGFGFDATYQLIAAVGRTEYVVGGIGERLACLAWDIHLLSIPIILLLYIPATRCRWKKWLSGLLVRNQVRTSVHRTSVQL